MPGTIFLMPGTIFLGTIFLMGGTNFEEIRFAGWHRLGGGWVKCEAIFFVVAKMSRRAIGGMLLNMLRFVIAAFLLAQFFHA